MGRLIVIAGIIVVALIIFAIVYAAMTRSRRAAARRRPVAPDDNPEFLRSIQLPDPPTDDEDDRG